MRASDAIALLGPRSPDVPPDVPLGIIDKLGVGLEVLSAYVPAWWLLRTNDVERMIRGARDVQAIPQGLEPRAERALARRLGRIVGRMLSLLPTDNRCLIRSLTLARLLSRRGIQHRLIIGVKPASSFAAHAWIEHRDEPILPAGDFGRLLEL